MDSMKVVALRTEQPEMTDEPETIVSDVLPRSYAEVDELEADWLWKGYLPSGQVVILAAPGGSGKSLCLIDLAARVSAGREMPGMPADSAQPPQTVVLASLEDSPECSLRGKLEKAGADLGNVYDASENKAGQPFDLMRDVQWLYQIASDCSPALVIVDTLAAASPVALSSPISVKRLMGNLLAFARKTGVCVVLAHHTTKDGKTIAGSKAVTDSVRQVLKIQPDEQDPRIRVLSVDKTNLTSSQAARFRISDTGTCQWLQTDETAVKPEDTARARIAAVLTDSPQTAQRLASLSGVSYPTTRVALSRMQKSGAVATMGMNSYVSGSIAA